MFSNKSLIIMGVAVLAISIFGTSISLNLIDGLSNVGYVPSDTGTVNLVIDTSLSIKLTDNAINFGTCLLTGGTMTFDSNLTDDGVNNSACDGTFPDFMTVENDGNVEVNVTVQTDALLTDEYDFATSSSMKFYSKSNESDCGTVVPTWTDFAINATDYTVCENFKTADAEDSFNFYIKITLPDTAAAGDSDGSLGLLFTASTV
jgi:hypothetical protein